MEKKVAHIQSYEGQLSMIELARNRGVINDLQYLNAINSLADEYKEKFEPNHKPSASVPEQPRRITQKERDSIYHKDAPECYPGIMRTKCAVYGNNKACLFLRIRTRDTEFDTSLKKLIGPKFEAEHKSDIGGDYYELRAINIPRDHLESFKEELDGIALVMIRLKEAGHEYNSSTLEFLKMLANPDWKQTQ